MRKLLFILPLFFMPALASAGHDYPLQKAAHKLNNRATQFYYEVADLRGNWQLKYEARQFMGLSRRFARQVDYSARPRKLRRSLRRLEYEFQDLAYAVDHARMRRGKKYLRKDLRRIARTLQRVERSFGPPGRLAYSYGQRRDRFPRYRDW